MKQKQGHGKFQIGKKLNLETEDGESEPIKYHTLETKAYCLRESHSTNNEKEEVEKKHQT